MHSIVSDVFSNLNVARPTRPFSILSNFMIALVIIPFVVLLSFTSFTASTIAVLELTLATCLIGQRLLRRLWRGERSRFTHSPSSYLSKTRNRTRNHVSLISIKCIYGPWIPQMVPMPTIRITWSRHPHYSRAKISLNSGGVYRLEETVAYRTSVFVFCLWRAGIKYVYTLRV
jgi:hypothetical protein